MTLARFRRRLILGTAALAAAGLAAGPANATLTISNGATKNVSCSAGMCAATAKNAVLNAGDLAGMLASSDVAVQSTSKAKDIELKVALSFASASRLTLDAYQSITFDKPLTVASSGALTLTTNDGGSGGELSFVAPGRVAFWDLSSSLVIDGASYTLAGDIAALASDIAADASGHYALANNYDASVDGTYGFAPVPTTFTGTFVGMGNTISMLTIKHFGGHDDVGFFSLIDSPGIVKEVILKSLSLTSKGSNRQSVVGGLAGRNFGTISNVSVNGGTIKGLAFSSDFFGGLVGKNFGTIEGAHTDINVVADNATHAGGLVALNDGLIENSSAAGSVSAHGGAGGLVAEHIGGEIVMSYATGSVSGAVFEASAGGLVGINEAVIDNSYATGAVSVPNGSAAGGLIGVQDGTQVTEAYSTGAPTGSGDIGGLIGGDGVPGNVANSYWDTDTSGITDPSQGAGQPPNDPGITGLTTSQLQSGLPGGFDPTIWAEDPAINGGLPYLLSNPPE